VVNYRTETDKLLTATRFDFFFYTHSGFALARQSAKRRLLYAGFHADVN